MQISIDSDIIQEAIRVALRLSPPITGNLTLEGRDSKLYLHSSADLSRCSILLPCTIKGKGIFAIPVDALKDATKGRKDVEMVYDKTMLKIKSGRYSVSLTTVDAIDPDAEPIPEGTKWKLTVDQVQWLKTAVANTALKPNANMTAFMPVSVKITSKSAFVSCFDENHMMFTNSREITGALDVTLPLEVLTAVLDVFNKVECEMTVTKSALYVHNKIVDVMLALPDTEDDAVETSMVVQKARESLKVDGKAIDIDKKQVTAFLDNARSVQTKERSELHVVSEPGSVTLVVKTTNGTARNKMKAATTAKTDFKIDFEYFEEAARKSADTVSFKFADSFLVFRCANAHSLIALNQES